VRDGERVAMTTTSPSEVFVNEVGSKGIHDRHTVALEAGDSRFARARVKDQLFIDHLLMDDTLTVDQHREAERILNLVVSASVYLKSPSMEGFSGAVQGGSGGGRNDIYSSALMRWHRQEKYLRRKWGDTGVGVVHDHIVLDVWTDSQPRISLLSQILDKKRGSRSSPVIAKVKLGGKLRKPPWTL
jgi:hypothetical protein